MGCSESVNLSLLCKVGVEKETRKSVKITTKTANVIKLLGHDIILVFDQKCQQLQEDSKLCLFTKI